MRRAYGAVALAICAALSGCGEGNSGDNTDAGPSCPYQAGALPQDTLPSTTRHGADIPVQHIVVLMQENRSFDSYFGMLPAAGHPDVDGLPYVSNRDAHGFDVFAFHQTKYCTVDTNHSWTGSHLEFDGGLNDEFVRPNDPDGKRAMGFYDQSDLPYDYALAKTFAIGDRYFCSLLAGTFANRFYLLTGTSFGHVRNDIQAGGFPQRSIFDLLDEKGISWKVYNTDFAYASLLKVQNRKNIVKFPAFLTDAAAGTLPPVAFVDPVTLGLSSVENDEHPPSNIQQGQQFVAQVVQALMQSPNWGSTVLFVTYDEHGGFFDHVPPPRACVPDSIPPMFDPTDPDTTFLAEFDNYGFRVPLVVVSPFSRPGFVSHNVYDHTSILRFIETRFDLPALTNRDANASPMLDMFDFDHPPFSTPPPLPEALVDPARLEQCKADFPDKNF